MASLLYRLGRFAARRSLLVVLGWVVLIALAGIGYGVGHGALSGAITIPGTATQKVADQLAKDLPQVSGGSGTLVAHTDDGKPFDDTQKQQLAALLTRIEKVPGVKSATDPFTTASTAAAQRQQLEQGAQQLSAAQQQLDGGKAQLQAAQQQLAAAQAQAQAAGNPPQLAAQLAAQAQQLQAQQAKLAAGETELQQKATQLTQGQALAALADGLGTVSRDGSAALVPVSLEQSSMAVPQSTKDELTALVTGAGIGGVTVDIGNDLSQSVPNVAGPGEVIGLVVAAIVLLVMLGTLLGAGLPLVSALVGVGVGVLAALSLSGTVDMISVTPVLGLMLGLAVGIDYSLFILNRHRRQLRTGMDLHESIGLANGTSGNAVVFAGSTVLIALLALNVTGIPFLGLMGTVAAFCVLVAILVAVTLTPAFLSLLGHRVLRRREREGVGRHEAVAVDRPMSTRRAVLSTVLAAVALVAVAVPALSLRLGLPDGSSEAVDSTQYRAYKTIEAKFGPGVDGPLLVVATLARPATDATLLGDQVAVGQAVKKLDGVVAVAPIGASPDKTVLAFQVVPTEGPNGEVTAQLVQDLRDLRPTVGSGTASIGVAGNASGNIDVSDKLASALPVYLGLVVGLSFVIMILVFRSLLVPLIATLGFVLSLFGALGGIVAIYQWGWLSSVFGTHDPGPILSFLPTLEIGILFGLAMDYQLFLVSGMREAWAHGASPRVAVRQGFRAGRTVVTAAAIIMISVFSGFIFSDSSTIRPIGFGLAFGVLLDAFVVRMLLVPGAHAPARRGGLVAAALAGPDPARRRRRRGLAGAQPPAAGDGGAAGPVGRPDGGAGGLTRLTRPARGPAGRPRTPRRRSPRPTGRPRATVRRRAGRASRRARGAGG